MTKPVVLIILDGWGQRPQKENNAAALAATPCLDRLYASVPSCELIASGRDVGLPDGQQGNSEVGHLNLGAGRIVHQDLVRIGEAVEEGRLDDHPVIRNFFKSVRDRGGRVHFMGLLSDGGVHSHQDHLYALLDAAEKNGIERSFVHAFLDGRDVPPKSAARYLEALEGRMHRKNYGQLASVSGRYYAMDRDQRYDRIEKAWRALVRGEAPVFASAQEGLVASYEADLTDEFVLPFVIDQGKAEGLGTIAEEDAVIFFNFRADRARQLTAALALANFDAFDRGDYRPRRLLSLTEYDVEYADEVEVAFAAVELKNTLGSWLAEHGKKQMRIAETEKYAHVTFFFNGGLEEPYPGEDRILVPSPKLATYDLQPEMSAKEVAVEVQRSLEGTAYDFILVNFANPDMVGHTGILLAAEQAMEAVDAVLAEVLHTAEACGARVLLTADHGNCEQMAQIDGSPHTAHTINPVACLLIGGPDGARLRDGRLADIAPTILDLLELEKPAEMTGTSLIEFREDQA